MSTNQFIEEIARLNAVIAKLREAGREAAFALESVAHLQGKERELLPIADRLRDAIGDA